MRSAECSLVMLLRFINLNFVRNFVATKHLLSYHVRRLTSSKNVHDLVSVEAIDQSQTAAQRLRRD